MSLGNIKDVAKDHETALEIKSVESLVCMASSGSYHTKELSL